MNAKHTSDYEAFEKAETNRRLLRQEELILEVTEALSRAIVELEITQTELAKRLGKTKGFVSQILGGGRNLTLRTLSDVVDALQCSISVHIDAERTEFRHAEEFPVEALPGWSGTYKMFDAPHLQVSNSNEALAA